MRAEYIIEIVATLLLLAYTGFITDTRRNGMKIKNWVVITVFCIGVVYHLLNKDVGVSLQGVLYGGVPLLVLYLAGMVGAGDLKLFAALGAVFGQDVLLVIIFTYSAFLVYSLYLMLSSGTLWSGVRREAGLFKVYAICVFYMMKGDFARVREVYGTIKGYSEQFTHAPLGGFIFFGATAVSGICFLTAPGLGM